MDPVYLNVNLKAMSLLAIVRIMPADAKPINLLVPLNSIHKNHNNPRDNAAHSLMIKMQIIPKIPSIDSSITVPDSNQSVQLFP